VFSSSDRSRTSEPELLERTASDPEAFGLFYDRYEREVLGFFYRATGRADIAADLTAEVFAAALESAGAFDPQLGSARGWLFGIARHKLADAWKHGTVEDRARRRLGMEPLAVTDEVLERIERLAPTPRSRRCSCSPSCPTISAWRSPAGSSRTATTRSWPRR
jgi:RNA polymerase sigma-70 factor (ECF subfamily)